MLCSETNLSGLSFCTTERLMYHDFCVGESIAFALGTTSEDDGAHTRSHTDSDCDNIRFYILHCIVDSETSCYMTTRTIDIHSNWSFCILFFEKEKLSNNSISYHRINCFTEKNYSVFHQTWVDIIDTFSRRGFIYNRRYESTKWWHFFL